MIGIAAIFRNEAPYLKEWIEFHLLMGVEKFYLFNNLSTDAYEAALEPYLTYVELTQWPLEHSNILEWNEIQCLAYERALFKAKYQVEWLAILDVDEFLFPVEQKSLKEVMADYKEFGGVGVNWQAFGTSSLVLPPNGLITETLTLKFPETTGTNHHVKSIVQPEHVLSCDNPHFVLYQPGFDQVDTKKRPFEGRLTPSILLDRLRINHYTLRDESYFRRQKVPRLQKWWNGLSLEEWEEKYKGTAQIVDTEIHRFLPELKRRLKI